MAAISVDRDKRLDQWRDRWNKIGEALGLNFDNPMRSYETDISDAASVVGAAARVDELNNKIEQQQRLIAAQAILVEVRRASIPVSLYRKLLAQFGIEPNQYDSFDQDITTIINRSNDDRNNINELKTVVSRVIEATGYNPDTYTGTTENLVMVVNNFRTAYKETLHTLQQRNGDWYEITKKLGMLGGGWTLTNVLNAISVLQQQKDSLFKDCATLTTVKAQLMNQLEESRAAHRETDAQCVKAQEDLRWITNEISEAFRRSWPHIHESGHGGTLRINWQALRDDRIAPKYKTK
jgi:hypothetical protein